MAFKVGWERDDQGAPIPPIVPPSPILADPEIESPVAPDPLDGFLPAEYATEAIQLARRALIIAGARLSRGDFRDEPLAAPILLYARAAGRDADPSALITVWGDRTEDGGSRRPWALPEDDRRLLAPVALVTSLELLLALRAGDDEGYRELAEGILKHVQPEIEDDVADHVLARDPWRDTFALWVLSRHPRALDELYPLAVAMATRYGMLATRRAGRVHSSRDHVGRAMVSGTAQLGSGLWALGLYPSLIQKIVRYVRLARLEDGSWPNETGIERILVTLAAGDLLLGLDPSFDPQPTITWLARAQSRDGWWRAVGREAPWLTVAVVDWLERAGRPFTERFTWPAVPKWIRDRRTGLPRYEYFADLAHAFSQFVDLEREPLEIGFADLAGFGEFNRQCGQEAGDEVLGAFAEVLQGTLPTCRVIRDGGDEFLVLGPPRRVGLGDDLDGFRRSWPSTFRARFGDDLPIVAPRFTMTSVTGGQLREARARLGIRIGELKLRPVGPDGSLDVMPAT